MRRFEELKLNGCKECRQACVRAKPTLETQQSLAVHFAIRIGSCRYGIEPTRAQRQ